MRIRTLEYAQIRRCMLTLYLCVNTNYAHILFKGCSKLCILRKFGPRFVTHRDLLCLTGIQSKHEGVVGSTVRTSLVSIWIMEIWSIIEWFPIQTPCNMVVQYSAYHLVNELVFSKTWYSDDHLKTGSLFRCLVPKFKNKFPMKSATFHLPSREIQTNMS